ncbi:MAG: nuclear transport factor 2 family protein [Acidobacteriia bacterium]|nr:nuclear transport factor 2 family protein [Terriglobia bacterium]
MKRLFTVALFFALSTILVLPASAQTNNRSIEKTITELENQWAVAQRDGKASVVAPMLADTFVNTDADGQTYGKAKLLSDLKGGTWEQNGISDVKVTVYGDIAIATGAWAGKGVDGDGSKVDRRERWTDTWVKMPNGQWQCVASQQTSTGKV